MRYGNLLTLVAALAMGTASARADVTVNYANGDLAARAVFHADGLGGLTVTLTNTSGDHVAAPGDVLTGLFFDVDGIGALTQVSALLTSVAGTPVMFPGVTTAALGYNNYAGVGDVGSEAGYRTGAALLQDNVGNHAIGMVGMDDFMGIWTRFDLDDAHDLQDPTSLNGIEYGLVNAGYNGSGNSPLAGSHALITTGVVYSFTGFTGVESDISNVSFNYGTEFNPTVIPAPGAAVLGMIGFSVIGRIKRRAQ